MQKQNTHLKEPAHVANSLPPDAEILEAFRTLGASVRKNELSYTQNTSLKDFETFCNKFIKPGREEKHHNLHYPYMVRRGVQASNDEPESDLYVIDFGNTRVAVSLDP